VHDVEVVKQLIEEANHRRSVGSTAANSDSSRSHSIMQFALKRFIAGGAASRLVSCQARGRAHVVALGWPGLVVALPVDTRARVSWLADA
jgi:hypothetical protein